MIPNEDIESPCRAKLSASLLCAMYNSRSTARTLSRKYDSGFISLIASLDRILAAILFMLRIACIPAVYDEQEIHLQGSGNITNVDETRKSRVIGWLVDVDKNKYTNSAHHMDASPSHSLPHVMSHEKHVKLTQIWRMSCQVPVRQIPIIMSHHTVGRPENV